MTLDYSMMLTAPVRESLQIYLNSFCAVVLFEHFSYGVLTLCSQEMAPSTLKLTKTVSLPGFQYWSWIDILSQLYNFQLQQMESKLSILYSIEWQISSRNRSGLAFLISKSLCCLCSDNCPQFSTVSTLKVLGSGKCLRFT